MKSALILFAFTLLSFAQAEKSYATVYTSSSPNSSISVHTSSSNGSEASVQVDQTINSRSTTSVSTNNNTQVSVNGGEVKIVVTGSPEPTIIVNTHTPPSYQTPTSPLSSSPTSTPPLLDNKKEKKNITIRSSSKNKSIITNKKKKLVGIIPISITIKQMQSEKNGQIITIEENWFSRILDVLSF